MHRVARPSPVTATVILKPCSLLQEGEGGGVGEGPSYVPGIRVLRLHDQPHATFIFDVTHNIRTTLALSNNTIPLVTARGPPVSTDREVMAYQHTCLLCQERSTLRQLLC